MLEPTALDGTRIEFVDGQLSANNAGSASSVAFAVSGLSLSPRQVVDLVFEPRLPAFVRGDANGDGALGLSDAVTTLRTLFGGAKVPADCDAALDADGDDNLSVTDTVFALEFLFRSGGPPPAPFPDCGTDLTATLPCARFSESSP